MTPDEIKDGINEADSMLRNLRREARNGLSERQGQDEVVECLEQAYAAIQEAAVQVDTRAYYGEDAA